MESKSASEKLHSLIFQPSSLLFEELPGAGAQGQIDDSLQIAPWSQTQTQFAGFPHLLFCLKYPR
jgi:hypothetical protein